jgi:flotillin
MQIASNGASIARAEAEKQAAVRQQREAELAANQITQAHADAEQNVIQQEAEGRAQAARIRAIAEAEAEAIRMKAEALMQSGQAYLDLKRLEMAPAITREVAGALSNGQFVNFGTSGEGGHSAAASGSDDVMRVVQTLMAAQVVTGSGFGAGNGGGGYARQIAQQPVEAQPQVEPDVAVTRPAVPPLPSRTNPRK